MNPKPNENMSSFNRVVIATPESGPEALDMDSPASSTPAVSDNNAPQESTDQPNHESGEAEGNQPKSEERPQWLPEKFKSAEDLAKAYSELEKKFSQPKQEQPKVEEPHKGDKPAVEKNVEPAKLDGKLDLSTFHNEYAQQGDLSQESFQKLEALGIPKELVTQYISGFRASQAAEAQTIFKETGGEEGYKAMTDWASKNMSEDEIRAYDNLVTSGDINAAKIAAKGLYAQYTSTTGKPPKLVGGKPSGKDNLTPYRSTSEVVQAMSDPRYKIDPAYRKDVERRIEMSDVF